MEECFGNAQMSSGADWQKFGDTLNDSQHDRQQVVVQASSGRVGRKVLQKSWIAGYKLADPVYWVVFP